MGKRDEFAEDVKRVIAGRAGYRCSDPECQQFTIGPTIDPTKTFNVGAACHIIRIETLSSSISIRLSWRFSDGASR